MIETQWIDDRAELTLIDLCQACGLEAEQITVWVVEGMLEPAGAGPDEWRFDSRSLARVRVAQRLVRDLQIDPPGVALALELLDEIAALRAEVRRLGG